MKGFRDKNFGKHPDDPDYIRDYDAEEDYERYLFEMELKYDEQRCDED